MLVEYVRLDPGLIQPIGQKIGIETLAGDVEANHRLLFDGRHSDSAITKRSRTPINRAALAAS